jgi:MOSC domain-containing protein YiiM
LKVLGVEGGRTRDIVVADRETLYAYPREHYRFWQTVRAQARVAHWDDALDDGALGERLTLEGLTEDRLWVGDRLRLPGCVLAVSAPHLPCDRTNAALGFPHAARLMVQSGYCGACLVVVEGGRIAAGDAIVVEPGPRDVNLRELFRARVGA